MALTDKQRRFPDAGSYRHLYRDKRWCGQHGSRLQALTWWRPCSEVSSGSPAGFGLQGLCVSGGAFDQVQLQAALVLRK
ncbi:hypothetical protein [Chelativorans alearense]|uniref:hypothetical protein n=1 Tax=Chelativorans alearense TaxID=2681495 RepID=UPI0013D49E34|nr:hypothetical protein [Chelativorans alearense]